MKKVIPIILFTVSAILLSACGRKEELYEIPDLSQYKTDYVGDSLNVINIVSGQEYPEGYSYDSIQIQSETKPYGLTVFLKVEPSAVKIEDELQVNADMTFDLIGNLETLDYKIADSKEIIASYERQSYCSSNSSLCNWIIGISRKKSSQTTVSINENTAFLALCRVFLLFCVVVCGQKGGKFNGYKENWRVSKRAS